MADESERVAVEKNGQIARPLKKDLDAWLNEKAGWALYKEPVPMKGVEK